MRFTSRVLNQGLALGNGALKGKTAIVTASTDGIGFAIARRMAQDGAKVWISSRRQDNVTTAIDTLRAEGLDVDGLVCHVGEEKHRQVN